MGLAFDACPGRRGGHSFEAMTYQGQFSQAVSYFVGAAAAGDDIGIKEDKGFAINPWTVRCGVEARGTFV